MSPLFKPEVCLLASFGCRNKGGEGGIKIAIYTLPLYRILAKSRRFRVLSHNLVVVTNLVTPAITQTGGSRMKIVAFGPAGNHIPKIAALKETHSVTGLHHVNIKHDDVCRIWKGGACDCDPDVELRKPER